VDVSSDSYAAALALQERVTAQDLAEPDVLSAIAQAAGLSPEQAQERYAPR
jgi:2-hydroxychromene-2-carboxylate isomerase